MEKYLYKDKTLFYYDERYRDILKAILDRNMKVLKILKENRRSYIAVVDVNGEKYIIKESRNEYRIFQRKLMSLFKKGEFVVTLENIHKMIYEEGMLEYAEPFGAVLERKNGMISYNLLLMEYVGEEIFPDNFQNMMKTIQKIHKKGYYHGDFNPSNFILNSSGKIRVIDTQGKKMGFGNYRAHYDLITMQMDNYPEMIYPYKKNIFYYVALGMKKFKRNKIVSAIKAFKNRMRDRRYND
ncbi:lipopolysaccharide core heptose(II) kinase RfaY [uncultured Cetobacterium sp.]|uniref:lipopolysaccharide core heptose(II) kinase RfaY n=1 Tax=uncultured Cetobacterium sp. TaxID=527638 RepID=UPI0025E4287B|nr:lipopolysaccharide core heptose(II) kinase RfaY [uncultured Cetobacterium sp.]